MKKTLYGLSLLLALSVLLPACQCTEAPATKTPLTEAQLSTEQKIQAAAIATDPDYVLMWKKEAEHQQRINAAVSTFSPQNRKAWFILMEELLQQNPDAYARKLGYTENGAGRELLMNIPRTQHKLLRKYLLSKEDSTVVFSAAFKSIGKIVTPMLAEGDDS